MEARKRYQTKDNQIHKFIRSNGTLTKHPKEQQLYNKIEEDMKVMKKLASEGKDSFGQHGFAFDIQTFVPFRNRYCPT